MGSLEEEQLWQMVNDFIETESGSPSHYYSSQSAPLLIQRTRSFNLQEILNNMTDYEAHMLEIVTMHMRNKMEMKKSTKLRRWLVLCLQMDGFNASLCQTHWPSSSCCPSGEYEYIDVVREEDENTDGQRLILDIDFKSQFEVARPTKSYSELSGNLPQIFVGSVEKLRKVIRILCSAAEESMRHRGLHIPPWRRAPYMHSKWLSDSTREGVINEKISKKKIREGTESESSKWNPPLMVVAGLKPKMGEIDQRRNTASGLAGHFSDISINCC